MFKAMKKKLKDQRGLTLIELLAVIVILGIIAAIAIPSIGGLINNSRVDAHIANAQQMSNSARLAATSGTLTFTNNVSVVNLDTLINGGYIEPLTDPSNNNTAYDVTNSVVQVTRAASGNLSFRVTLDRAGNEGAYFTLLDPATMIRTNVDTTP